MEDSRYKKYSDCNIDELEQIVMDLENMSISALKNKKLDRVLLLIYLKINNLKYLICHNFVQKKK